MWEHEWNEMRLNNPRVQQYFKNYQKVEPLFPRHALYGGLTNAIKLYHKCAPEEQIYYYDITSLYPAVQKYGEYPKGHPTIFTENFDAPEKYFGLIKCKILRPHGLYFPVLPVRGIFLYSCLKFIFTGEVCSHHQLKL